MFAITEAEAAAIRAAFERGGEFSAAAELRRLFPGIPDTEQARECARTHRRLEAAVCAAPGEAARQVDLSGFPQSRHVTVALTPQ
jgi:hypothetical protein